MKGLSTKFYERLTPWERFKLVLEAKARGDEEEVCRLAETCPKKTYSMRDAGFVDLVEASRMLTWGFLILWLHAKTFYLAVEAAARAYMDSLSFFVEGYVQGANSMWKRAGKDGVPFDVEGREPTPEELKDICMAAAVNGFPEQIAEVLRSKADELRALWQGFAAFCENEGLDPEILLLTWWPPLLEEVRQKRELLSVPAESAKEAFEYFSFLWSKAVGG